MVTTYVRKPVISTLAGPLPDGNVAYPVTLRTGRTDIASQPEPAELTFTMPFSALLSVPSRGQQITMDVEVVPTKRYFYGKVASVVASHQPWQPSGQAVFVVRAVGWMATYAGLPLVEPYRVEIDDEQGQLDAMKAAWGSQHDLLSYPINRFYLDTTNKRHAIPLGADAMLLGTLHDFAARSGAVVWETPTAVEVNGPGQRVAMSSSTLIPGRMVPKPIDYLPSPIYNEATVLFGAYDEQAALGTYVKEDGIFVWQSTGTHAAGEIQWTGPDTIDFWRTDYNTDKMDEWLKQVVPGSLLVVRDLVDDEYTGLMVTSHPTWYSTHVAMSVERLLGGIWNPTVPSHGEFVSVRHVASPPRQSTRAFDTDSITAYGNLPVTIDSGLINRTPAAARATEITNRWAEERWVPKIEVRTHHATSQAQWDATMKALVPNNLVEIENLWANGGHLGPTDDLYFTEGVTHQWNRLPGGRLVHVAELLLTAKNEASVAYGAYPSSTTYPSTTLYPGA